MMILDAMKVFKEKTCVRFVEKTIDHADFINITDVETQ